MAMVVDGHGLLVLVDGPGQGHHDLEAGQGRLGLGLVVGFALGPCRQDMEQVVGHDVGFGEASRNVHAVGLFVVEADPSFQVAQDFEGVVAEFVAVVVDAPSTELGGGSVRQDEATKKRGTCGLTADTKLLMWARTSGCTTSLLLTSVASMVEFVEREVAMPAYGL